MTDREFQTNLSGAKIFLSLSQEYGDSDFWVGYQRGIRRNYLGEKFGTPNEHSLWISLDGPDLPRKMRGLGYRAGFDGQNIQAAMKILAAHQYLSEIGYKGGSISSPRKTRAVRRNAKLGGRPPKKEQSPGPRPSGPFSSPLKK